MSVWQCRWDARGRRCAALLAAAAPLPRATHRISSMLSKQGGDSSSGVLPSGKDVRMQRSFRALHRCSLAAILATTVALLSQGEGEVAVFDHVQDLALHGDREQNEPVAGKE